MLEIAMRMTTSMMLSQYLRNTGVKVTDPNYPNILADFKQSLGNRYQIVLSKMSDYRTEIYDSTFSTVANQQFYAFPAGLVNMESVFITIGSVKYTLKIINSEDQWNRLNAIQIQASQVPQYFFPRINDFGIWPTPQAIYTGTMSYHYRDRNLSVDDYTNNSVQVVDGSTTITGNGTVFTPAMVGRWFSVTDPTVNGQGYWYRIGSYTSATVIDLETYWSGTGSINAQYVIGETPELPEEGHMILVYGATADFFSNLKNDETSATRWENRFWTGDPTNGTRKFGDNDVLGGVIGLVNKYVDRNETHLVDRRPHIDPLNSKVFGVVLSES